MKRKAVSETVKAGKAHKARPGGTPNEAKQSSVAAADVKRYVAQCVLLHASPLSQRATDTAGTACASRSRKEVKSGKLAKRKKNYNLVQVRCCCPAAQDAWYTAAGA